MRKLEWKFVCLPCRYECNEKVVRNADKTSAHREVLLENVHLYCHQSERKDWDFLNVLEKINTWKGRGVALQH